MSSLILLSELQGHEICITESVTGFEECLNVLTAANISNQHIQ